MKTSVIRVKQDDDGSWAIFIDESLRGRYDNAQDMANMLGLALVEIEDQQRLIDQLELYKRAMESMASQIVHPKVSAKEMAERQLSAS